MHESIAMALYRGHERKLAAFDSELLPQPKKVPATRAAWTRSVLKRLRAWPLLVTFQHWTLGSGKNTVTYLVGLLRADEPGGRSGWYGAWIEVDARHFDIRLYDMPVMVTHHLVQRTMQRLEIHDPRVALSSLEIPVFCALHLGEPGDFSELFPSPGGGVIAVRDRHDESCWALVTFVDIDKLGWDQRERLVDHVEALQRAGVLLLKPSADATQLIA